MSYEYVGACGCGLVSFNVELPNSICEYQPRACDCGYCVERKSSYLSDPEGALVIFDAHHLKREQQGDLQAVFHRCLNCGDLVAVTYAFESGLKGALNAALLSSILIHHQPLNVSSKALSVSEKLERWNASWMKVILE
jgi:hypothetical protein